MFLVALRSVRMPPGLVVNASKNTPLIVETLLSLFIPFSIQLKAAVIQSLKQRGLELSKISVCTVASVIHSSLLLCVDSLLFGHMEGSGEQHSVCQSKYLMKHTCGPTTHGPITSLLPNIPLSLSVCMCVCVCRPELESMPCLCVCFYIESESKSRVVIFDCFSKGVGPNCCGCQSITTYSSELSKASLDAQTPHLMKNSYNPMSTDVYNNLMKLVRSIPNSSLELGTCLSLGQSCDSAGYLL